MCFGEQLRTIPDRYDAACESNVWVVERSDPSMGAAYRIQAGNKLRTRWWSEQSLVNRGPRKLANSSAAATSFDPINIRRICCYCKQFNARLEIPLRYFGLFTQRSIRLWTLQLLQAW